MSELRLETGTAELPPVPVKTIWTYSNGLITAVAALEKIEAIEDVQEVRRVARNALGCIRQQQRRRFSQAILTKGQSDRLVQAGMITRDVHYPRSCGMGAAHGDTLCTAHRRGPSLHGPPGNPHRRAL